MSSAKGGEVQSLGLEIQENFSLLDFFIFLEEFKVQNFKLKSISFELGLGLGDTACLQVRYR